MPAPCSSMRCVMPESFSGTSVENRVPGFLVGSGKGWLSAGGSHGLQQLMTEVAREVMDPRTAFQVVHMLEGVVQRGTAVRLRALDLPLDLDPFATPFARL